jgi:hypothetical protein
MSINEYLKMPPPTPSIQSPPINSHHKSPQSQNTQIPPIPPPPQLSFNDQIKMLSMKYKIAKNFSEMFQLNNMVSPFRNMLILQFLGVLIEKYKNDPDHLALIRLHGIIDSAFRTTCVSFPSMDECIYLCNNPRVIEAIYHFTGQ